MRCLSQIKQWVSHTFSRTKNTRHWNYRPDIDGLRAIAVLAVVFFHAFPGSIRGGFVGVDIFFVISGYLISGIIFSRIDQGNFSFSSFYAARVRRIFPALIIVLWTILGLGWFLLLTDEYVQLGKHIAGAAAFLSNFILWKESGYFDNASATKPLLHLWSLGVEEQFYLVWPFVLVLSARLKWPVATPLFFIMGASAATNLAIAHVNSVADFYSPVSRFWELMTGASLAWYRVRPKTSSRCLFPRSNFLAVERFRRYIDRQDIRHSAASIAGGFLILASCFVLNKKMTFPGYWVHFPVIGTALIIYAGPHAIINRIVLSNRIVVAVGLISYPLYLWHWPLLSYAEIVFTQVPPPFVRLGIIVLSTMLAALTYYAVERPVRFGRHSSYLTVALCLALIVTGAAGYGLIGRDGLNFRAIARANKSMQDREDVNTYLRNQFDLKPCSFPFLSPKIDRFCTISGNPRATHTLILWGDSHSGQELVATGWSAVFYTIARDRGDTRVIRFSHPGCPPLVGVRRTDATGNADYCSDLSQGKAILDAISKLHPTNIVLLARWSLYTDGMRTATGALERDTHFITTDPYGVATAQSSVEAFQAQFLPMVHELSNFAPVLIIKNPPVLKKTVASALAVRVPWLKKSLFGETEANLAHHLEISRATSEVIDKATILPNVKVFDPTPFLCDTNCAFIKDGIVMYSDDNHPSPVGSLWFKAQIEALM